MATILIVDDEKMMCDLLRAVFGCHGHEILTAENGVEGLRLFKQRRPRFTLLDMHMPEMNGIEVLKQIRKIDPKAGVIMLTGKGTDVLEIQARGLGVTDFLSKMLPLEVLVRTMEKALSRSVETRIVPPLLASGGALSKSQEAESILIVDDEPDLCSMVSRFLIARGYRVRTAYDAPTALDMVAQEPPRFVIADMYMPGMNGLEMVRTLRAKGYSGGILALTGSREENLLQGMLDLGAVDVMGKPVDLEKLELVVQLGCLLTTA